MNDTQIEMIDQIKAFLTGAEIIDFTIRRQKEVGSGLNGAYLSRKTRYFKINIVKQT